MRFAFDEQIESQPDAVQAVIDRPAPPRLDPSRPLLFAGLGTSLHACRVAAAWAGFPAAAIIDVPPDAQVVVVTHGGKGPFASAALAKARAAGARTFAILGEHAPALDADVLLRTCPRERAETHTVSYLTALAVLGRMLGLDLREAPRLLREALAAPPPLPQARLLADCDPLLVTGFGLDAITAAEAALKLKEATFKWAEGMPVEEALHGPHAALRKGMGAVLIPPAPDDGGRTEALRTLSEERGVTTVVSKVLPCPEALRPLVAVVPLQRLTAELARLCGGDPDHSRL